MSTLFNMFHSQQQSSSQHDLDVRNEGIEHVITRLHRDLLDLREQLKAISDRIATIKTTINGLAQIFGPGIIDKELQRLLSRHVPRHFRRQPGLTAACRRTLREWPTRLTLEQIFGQMQEKYPIILTRHKNPRITLSVVLGRLVDYGEAEVITSPEGSRTWKWAARQQFEAMNENNSRSE